MLCWLLRRARTACAPYYAALRRPIKGAFANGPEMRLRPSPFKAWTKWHRMPGPRCKIWRYMNFAKFASLVNRKALFFCAASALGDPFEGSFPFGNVEARKKRPFDVSNEAEFYSGLRGEMFLNCWNMSAHESAALWKLYGRDDKAIAIESTYRRLQAALPKKCIIGAVTYLEYSSTVAIPDGTVYAPYFFKRRSFEHEHELRAFIPGGSETGVREAGGIYEPVNVEALVTRVRLSPASPAWYRKTVEDLLQTLRLNLEVQQSAMDARPIF